MQSWFTEQPSGFPRLRLLPQQGFHPSPYNLKLLLEVHCRKLPGFKGAYRSLPPTDAVLLPPGGNSSGTACGLLCSSHSCSRIVRAFSAAAEQRSTRATVPRLSCRLGLFSASSLRCLFSKPNPGLWAFFHQDFQGKWNRSCGCRSWGVDTPAPGRAHQKVWGQRLGSSPSRVGNTFGFFIFCKTL